MDLRRADAAIAAYREHLDGRDVARLDFFRTVWEVQQSCAEEAGQAGRPAPVRAESVPSADDLRAWYAAGEPVFSHAPAPVDEAALMDALVRVSARFVREEGFSPGLRQALGDAPWEPAVAASPLAMAGRDPGAYLEHLMSALGDRGFAEGHSRSAGLVAVLALRPLLADAAAGVSAALVQAAPPAPHPLACPVCGGAAAAAQVGGGGVEGQGRKRTLWCALCSASWEFERVRCARCGTRNQAHLHSLSVEGDAAHRLAVCEGCGGYVRTVYVDDMAVPFSFEVEDVVMAGLDALAADRLPKGTVR